MRIQDKVYGSFELSEPVLIALIKSKPLLRIKGVNQAGTQLVKPHKKTTRFEHCVGVMLLLKKYGASLQEQIAGLLHDVPHTAFSHVIDFAVGDNEGQTFHENFKEQMILNSEIPQILKKYNIDVYKVLNEKDFSLLEQMLPALCADRIDYFLRDLVNDFGHTNDIDYFLKHIVVRNGKFVMDSRGAAEKFSRLFMKMCLESWADPLTLATFNLLASATRKALNSGKITETDLFLTDKVFLKKLKAIKDPDILKFLKLLTPQLSISLSDKDYDFHSWGKPRYVDPPIYINGKTTRLSQLNKEYAKTVVSFKKKVLHGYKIKVHGLI